MELGIRLPRITELFIDAHNLHFDLALFAICLVCGVVAIAVPGKITRQITPAFLLVMSLLLTVVVVYAMFLPLMVTIGQHGLPQSAG